jgi:UDP-N-acetylglucosamine 2-epimerase (hydrolysing)
MNSRMVFLTGTRADFGKMKPLIKTSHNLGNSVYVIATGMHMIEKYGFTFHEVNDFGYGEVFSFSNSSSAKSQDEILAKSIQGLSGLVKEINPDFIIVHGDRLEALAGAIVGNFNRIRVIHIEGGEVSGTIDEVIRHSISKLSHIHLVSNESAKSRLIQMGESVDTIFVIGSPEVDTFSSPELPEIIDVKTYYDIKYAAYSIFIYHPVFYEINDLETHTDAISKFLISSQQNWIVILPNNDPGSNVILQKYKEFEKYQNLKLIPSMRFEYFVTLLRESKMVVGNSSVGVREAPYFGIPSINIGSRQRGRSDAPSIKNVSCDFESLVAAEIELMRWPKISTNYFGGGGTGDEFGKLLQSANLQKVSLEKTFVDTESREHG